jgi:hypothetical protein
MKPKNMSTESKGPKLVEYHRVRIRHTREVSLGDKTVRKEMEIEGEITEAAMTMLAQWFNHDSKEVK